MIDSQRRPLAVLSALVALALPAPGAALTDAPGADAGARPAASLGPALTNAPGTDAGARPAAAPRARKAEEDALRAALPRGSRLGAFAAWVDSGAPIVAVEPDGPLRPASTAKLLTTACALRALGPAHRFTTALRAARPVGADGVLRGHLYVVGGGDPQLRAEDLWSIARNLTALGLTRVEGDLVGDGGLFADGSRPASWPAAVAARPYEAGQSALALAWNSLQVVVTPGARAGAPARVRLFPASAPVALDARVTTGSEKALRVSIDESGERSPPRVVVRGGIAPGSAPRRRWFRLGAPTDALLAALAEILDGAGIAVAGAARAGPAPDGAVTLHEHESRPLSALVADVNKYSSNFGAEVLLRALDRAAGGAGSTGGGLDALRACLGDLGVDSRGAVLVDGSGYGRGGRLTARVLVDLLLAADANAAWGPELVASLPRAGEDGSLERRLERWTGRVRAKTGSLTGVRSLAGLAATPSGRRFAFALLVNAGADGAGPTTAHVDDAARILFEIAERGERQDESGRGARAPAANGRSTSDATRRAGWPHRRAAPGG